MIWWKNYIDILLVRFEDFNTKTLFVSYFLERSNKNYVSRLQDTEVITICLV